MARHKNTISLKREMCAGRNLHEPEFDPAKRKNPGPRGKCQKKRSKLRGTYPAKEIRYLEINLVRDENKLSSQSFFSSTTHTHATEYADGDYARQNLSTTRWRRGKK